MINRRGALAAMAAATCGAVSSKAAIARLFRLSSARPDDVAGTAPISDDHAAVDERLRADLARLSPREYSEEGIPVFLACEDLLQARPPSPATTRFNAALVIDIRKNIQSWQRIHPDAPDTDVAKVIEVLADRDFADGGKEHQQ